MNATFVELPAFDRHREQYLDDEGSLEGEEGRSAGHLLLVGGGAQFWLFTLFDKDEMSDLSPDERAALKRLIKMELEARRKQ